VTKPRRWPARRSRPLHMDPPRAQVSPLNPHSLSLPVQCPSPVTHCGAVAPPAVQGPPTRLRPRFLMRPPTLRSARRSNPLHLDLPGPRAGAAGLRSATDPPLPKQWPQCSSPATHDSLRRRRPVQGPRLRPRFLARPQAQRPATDAAAGSAVPPHSIGPAEGSGEPTEPPLRLPVQRPSPVTHCGAVALCRACGCDFTGNGT